jgi:hypothetical protein
MKNLSSTAKAYILGTILVGLGLIIWKLVELDWANTGLYLLAALGAVAQTLKVEGPNNRTNYSIAWFVYGLAFVVYSPGTALFVIVISHLVEWIWHKYPWYIQSFNIGNHVISVYLAGLVFETLSQGTKVFDLNGAMGIAAANLIFVFGNHFLVGLVVKLARDQSFSESGVFEFLTLSLDFTVLTLGTVTALAWSYNPFLSVLNIPLLYPLYNALRIPAQKRQLQEMKT